MAENFKIVENDVAALSKEIEAQKAKLQGYETVAAATSKEIEAQKAKLHDYDGKIKDQEQNWKNLKWGVGIVGIVVVLITGVSIIKIPEVAKDKAIAAVTPLATSEAKAQVEAQMPTKVSELLSELESNKNVAAKAVADSLESKTRIDTLLKELNSAEQVRNEIKALKTDVTNLAQRADSAEKNFAVLATSSLGGKIHVSDSAPFESESFGTIVTLKDRRSAMVLVNYYVDGQTEALCTDLLFVAHQNPRWSTVSGARVQRIAHYTFPARTPLDIKDTEPTASLFEQDRQIDLKVKVLLEGRGVKKITARSIVFSPDFELKK